MRRLRQMDWRYNEVNLKPKHHRGLDQGCVQPYAARHDRWIYTDLLFLLLTSYVGRSFLVI